MSFWTPRALAALNQDRALYTSAQDNRLGAGPRLAMPTLALSREGLAANVGEVGISGRGHYVHEERAAEVADALERFFSSTATS